MDIPAFLDLVHSVATHTVMIIILFEGVRRLRQKDFSKGAIAMALLGSAYLIAYSVYAHRINNIAQEVSAPRHEMTQILNLASDWGAELPAAQRTRTSLEFARMSFYEYGRLRPYFDLAGKRIPYSPSQTDIDERERKVTQQSRLEAVVEMGSDSPVRLLLLALTAILSGLLWPSKKGTAAG